MSNVALITGSAVRIGHEISSHLAGKGWDLALHFSSSYPEAYAFQAELKSKYPGQRFITFKTNLGDPDQTSKLIQQVIEQFGTLNLLVNNAAVFVPSSLKETANELLRHHTTVNYMAPYILMRDFANKVVKGQVINIIDTRITNNTSDYLAYSISKKALWELTKMAALELAPNFRINAIAPGAVLPPEGKDLLYLEKIAGNTPMKTPSGIISILKSIDYIVENQYLTGQLIFCDGGSHLL